MARARTRRPPATSVISGTTGGGWRARGLGRRAGHGMGPLRVCSGRGSGRARFGGRRGAEWKLRGGANKFVLREAMRDRIPESVRIRKDKMGFPTPMKQWLAAELYAPVRELLAGRDVRERGIYDSQAILRDLEAHRRGGEEAAGRAIRPVQVRLWGRVRQERGSREETSL